MGSDEGPNDRTSPEDRGVDVEPTCNHENGHHDISCIPSADPNNGEVRLLRAIYGLCPLCDDNNEHSHSDEEYLNHGMVPYQEM